MWKSGVLPFPRQHLPHLRHLLIADDPWTGIGGHDGVLRLVDAPGLGVTPTATTGSG